MMLRLSGGIIFLDFCENGKLQLKKRVIISVIEVRISKIKMRRARGISECAERISKTRAFRELAIGSMWFVFSGSFP